MTPQLAALEADRPSASPVALDVFLYRFPLESDLSLGLCPTRLLKAPLVVLAALDEFKCPFALGISRFSRISHTRCLINTIVALGLRV